MMVKRSTYAIMFFIKKTKLLKNGEAPLYLRITINSQREEISLKTSILPNLWLSEAGKANPKSKNGKKINAFIDSVKIRLNEIYKELIENRDKVSSKLMKNKFLGITDENEMTLVKLFNQHNDGIRKLIGIDYVPGSVQRYEITLRHLQSFMISKYGEDDIIIADINPEYVNSFEIYLKTVRQCSHNTSMKYMRSFKKITLLAFAHGYTRKDPFVNYRITIQKTDRGFLTEIDLNKLINKEFKIERLEKVKDCFLFSCFTGLAHVDLIKLKPEDISVASNDTKWIKINRQKTGELSSIPILPAAQQILNKYKDDPHCILTGKLLPVNSNQKMNAYLKEIADLCGIKQNLSSHLARHTFATTVTLNNDVPIETVSKMLGHTSIKMTKIYARLLDKKVENDMSQLMDKY